jgi:hypothetical protein
LNNPGFQAKWTLTEDKRLIELVGNSVEPNWTTLTSHFPGKTVHQIVDRWEKVVNPSLVKGSWTREEDEVIINWVATHGATSWTKLAEGLPGRIGKHCRERWHNGLNPDLVRSTWLPQEDQLIEKLQRQWGNKWAKIAELMPGRTDNAVKNRWNSTLKRRTQTQPLPPPAVSRPAVAPPPPVVIPIAVVVDYEERDAPTFGSPTWIDLPPTDNFEMDWKDRQIGLFDMAAKFEGFDSGCPPMASDNFRLGLD